MILLASRPPQLQDLLSRVEQDSTEYKPQINANKSIVMRDKWENFMRVDLEQVKNLNTSGHQPIISENGYL